MLLFYIKVPAYYLVLKQLINEIKIESKDYIRFSMFEARARDRLDELSSITG